MATLPRVLAFGFVSGLLWSVVPGILANLFSSRADVPATIAAGVLAGVITSLSLACLVASVGRTLAVIVGLLSLPFGAFVFGFVLALIDRFVPALTDGSRALAEPWALGANYALLSVISVFAIGLFPLAVLTTFALRGVILQGKRRENAV